MVSTSETLHSKRPTQISCERETASEIPCGYIALVIVDADANVRHSFWNGDEGDSVRSLLCGADRALRADIAAIVTQLIAQQSDAGLDSCVVLRDGGRTLRLSPLAGPQAGLSVLVMEADSRDGLLTRAASQYHLTRRQAEVLALVLEGASANDVARALVISEYTAQGYVKTLLAKTNSRNRAAMVAKVLNWKRPEDALGDKALREALDKNVS
jgi:DNA-binding CsgD family transcriptional regulator